MPEPAVTCATRSREVSEPLYGTFKRQATTWFLLEYNGSWEHEAVESSDIPQAVKDFLDAVPRSHTLLIRQPGRFAERDSKITLFIVAVEAENPRQYRLDLNDYESILDLDVDAILAGQAVSPVDGPLFTVCSNGKRDTCCARHGVPLYNALSVSATDAVWQCTHISGHRFAATMIVFPYAICYGRVRPEDAAAIYESAHDGKLLTSHYRGRALYDQPVQAAEYYLREQTGEQDIAAYRLLDTANDDDRWFVRFSDDSGQVHELELVTEMSEFTVLKSCGDEAFSSMPQYRLVRYTAGQSQV